MTQQQPLIYNLSSLGQWLPIQAPCITNLFFLFVQRGTTPSEAPDKTNNQPRIVLFQDEEDDDDLLRQYFIAVEQHLVMESSNLVAAGFYLLSAHYIFNVQYHPKAKELLSFLQEKVLCLSSSKYKRSPAIVSHIGGISRYVVEED